MTAEPDMSPRRPWLAGFAGVVAVIAVSVGLGAWHRSPQIVAEDTLHTRHRDRNDKHHLKPEDRSALDEPANTTSPPKPRRVLVPIHADAAVDDSTALAYQSAVEAYRAKRWSDAATELDAFVATHGSAPEVEDALFLDASALAHDGQRDAAAAVAERFLAKYPTSFHAPDAAILVARSARDHGDCARARTVLAPWSEAEATLGACVDASAP